MRGTGIALSALALAVTALLIIAPISNAASVSVYLYPDQNSASVNAFVNSTLEIEVSRSDILLSSLISGVGAIMSGNISINASYSHGNQTFLDLNSSIASRDNAAKLESLNASFTNTVENRTSQSSEILYANSSLYLSFMVSGIFTNGTANLSWRSMYIGSGISIESHSAGIASVNGSMVSLLNFSAFQVSLEKWSRSYDISSNVTTFTFNAGTTQNYSWSAYNRMVNLSLKVDPSFLISTPGYAIASNNSISIEPSPAHDTAVYYVIAGIFIAGAMASFYMSRRRR